MTASERFWAKVVGDDFKKCWLWTGPFKPEGYGKFAVGRKRQYQAHRFAYEDMVGEIPPGLQLDHLCRVRACVNPWHLEPVTNRVNSIRGDGRAGRARHTSCQRGHPFDAVNTIHVQGRRRCRECVNARRRLA